MWPVGRVLFTWQRLPRRLLANERFSFSQTDLSLTPLGRTGRILRVQRSQRRILELDGLRGAAIFLVLIFHYVSQEGNAVAGSLTAHVQRATIMRRGPTQRTIAGCHQII